MKAKLVLISILVLSFGCTTAKFSESTPRVGDFKSGSTNSTVSTLVAKEPGLAKLESGAKAKDRVPERELTYEGEASLVTDDIPNTSKSIRQDCKDLGGYLFSMSSYRLNLRIPAKHLESFMSGLEKYGKVESSNIQADDVTDKHFDFRVRINNAEKLRQRLLDLSAKAKSVEEALKLEHELARVTAELESMKGFLKRSSEEVKFSKLLIELSSPEPIKKVAFRVPFGWVNSLAQHLKNPRSPHPKMGGWFSRNIEADVPDGFAAFYNYEDNFWAMNGQGGFYHISKVHNQVPDGGLKFWQQTIKRFLVQGKLMTIESSKEVVTKSGKGFQISASYGAGRSSMTYLVQVVPGEDEILVSELWGVVGDVSANTELLQEVMKNVKASL